MRFQLIAPIFIAISLTSCDQIYDPSIAEAKTNIKLNLKDPDSAIFRNHIDTRQKIVCGEVNAKNSFGGFIGYRSFIYKETDKSVIIEGSNSDGLSGMKAVTRYLQNANACGPSDASEKNASERSSKSIEGYIEENGK